MCTVQLGAHAALPKSLPGSGQHEQPHLGDPSSDCISKITVQCQNCSWLLVLVGIGWDTAEPMTPNTWTQCPDTLFPPLQEQQFGKSTSAGSKHRAQGCLWDPVLEGQDSSPGFWCSPFTEQLFPCILLLPIHRAALLLARDYSC